MDARLDLWPKELAPSPALRKWFGHRGERWKAFRERYQAELAAEPDDAFTPRVEPARERRVTLLYSARNPEINHARALREHLRSRFGL